MQLAYALDFPSLTLISGSGNPGTRNFNPNTDDIFHLFALIDTMIQDTTNSIVETYAIVQPADGWLRVYNPQTATTGNVYDVAATLAEELAGTVNAYTLTAATIPTNPLSSYEPLTDDWTETKAALATLALYLQGEGIIG